MKDIYYISIDSYTYEYKCTSKEELLDIFNILSTMKRIKRSYESDLKEGEEIPLVTISNRLPRAY